MTANYAPSSPLSGVIRVVPERKTVAAQHFLGSQTLCNLSALFLTRFYIAFYCKKAVKSIASQCMDIRNKVFLSTVYSILWYGCGCSGRSHLRCGLSSFGGASSIIKIRKAAQPQHHKENVFPLLRMQPCNLPAIYRTRFTPLWIAHCAVIRTDFRKPSGSV